MSVSFEEHHAPNVKSYLLVFGALLALTVVTVLISYIHLPIGLAVALGMAVACLKAGLVGAVFMHLKGERKLIFALLALTVAFTIVMMSLPAWDISMVKKSLSHGEAPLSSSPHGSAEHGAPGEAAPHK